jgi:hypothetical protein
MTGTILTTLISFQRVSEAFTPAIAGTLKLSAESIGWTGAITIFILWKTGNTAR